jgi:hypothetical protein
MAAFSPKLALEQRHVRARTRRCDQQPGALPVREEGDSVSLHAVLAIPVRRDLTGTSAYARSIWS